MDDTDRVIHEAAQKVANSQVNLEHKSVQHVVVTDVKMPVGSMVVFMVKWAVAAIPALVILAVAGLSMTAMWVYILSLLHG